MTKHESGAVAIISLSGGYARLAMWTYPDEVWVDCTGSRWTDSVESVRPLVVLDPDDAEQAAQVRKALGIAGPMFTVSDLQAALRSLVSPPRPPEPTGLGAVVEDADGCRWVRGYPSNIVGLVWRNGTTTERAWRDIDVAEVLNEGVQ